MAQFDGVGYARCECESELEDTDAETEEGYGGLVEFGIYCGLERGRRDELRLEVGRWWYGWYRVGR